MKFAVNPNRMELLKIKRRIMLARKGHKLLKDKQEELMRRFIAAIEEAKNLRTELDSQLRKAQSSFLQARARMMPEELNSALSFPRGKMEIDVSTDSVLNVKVPVFKISGTIDPYIYGLAFPSAFLDKALGIVSDLWQTFIKIAEVETRVEALAKEIEKTRRRVNALEYVLIPSLDETYKFITMKISEDDRANLIRLIRVKEIIESKETVL